MGDMVTIDCLHCDAAVLVSRWASGERQFQCLECQHFNRASADDFDLVEEEGKATAFAGAVFENVQFIEVWGSAGPARAG